MSHRTVLVPAGHSKPVGRYSPGVSVAASEGARWVFVSGQVATDADGTVLGRGDAREQAEVVFDRLRSVLAEAGARLADVVSVVIYLVELERDFRSVSGVRDEVFTAAPASTLVEVSRLAESGCLVEISAVALAGSSESS